MSDIVENQPKEEPEPKTEPKSARDKGPPRKKPPGKHVAVGLDEGGEDNGKERAAGRPDKAT